MTAQVPETVRIDGTTYALCGVRGEGLFNPEVHGIEPAAPDSSCWRGFICGYAVNGNRLVLDEIRLWSEPDRGRRNRQLIEDLFGTGLELDDDPSFVHATDLAYPVLFTGGLLLGDGFFDELQVRMGFQPAYKYTKVLELTFESGLVLSRSDRSLEMEEIRLREGRGDGKRSKDVVAWIKDCFRIDY
jgi:hypothetical protein